MCICVLFLFRACTHVQLMCKVTLRSLQLSVLHILSLVFIRCAVSVHVPFMDNRCLALLYYWN